MSGTGISKRLKEFSRIYQESFDRMEDEESRIYYESSRPKYEHILKTILKLGAKGRILDVGTSHFTILISRMLEGFEVYTADLNEGWFDRARQGGVVCNTCDLEQEEIPFADEFFDVVIFSEVLEHIRVSPKRVFKEMNRVLKKDGFLITTTPNLARISNRLRLLVGITPLETIHQEEFRGHFREYTMREIVEFLKGTGFKVVSKTYPMYWNGFLSYYRILLRGFDEEGRFYSYPKFSAFQKVLMTPAFAIMQVLLYLFPSLRTAIFVVAVK